MDGVRTVDAHGYEGCLALESGEARVVLGHHAGGRVLELSVGGENALYLDPAQDGWVYDPNATPEPTQRGKPGQPGQRAQSGQRAQPGQRGVNPTGGRCDIGPEHVVPRRPTLWLGAWTPEAVGPRHGRMTSQDDPATGVRLTRDFTLHRHEAGKAAHVTFTQTQTNVSDRVTEWCHWSRTFAPLGGIGIVPLSKGVPGEPISRFPNGYVMYGPAEGIGPAIGFRPEDPNIVRRSSSAGKQPRDYLLVSASPRQAKLGFDSYAPWMAYVLPDGRLFVKRFETYPERVYNEVAGITSCIYYPKERYVELEPIGPREQLRPGESASFTEDWWVLPFGRVESAETLDLDKLVSVVESTVEGV